MSTHLSTQQLEKYRQRSMTPAELLEAGDHLVVCQACQSKLGEALQVDATLSALREDFMRQAAKPQEHLSYEQLSAYVDDHLDEVEREMVDSHTTVCAPCKEELRDLFAFKDTLPAKAPAAAAVVMPQANETVRGRMGLWWRRSPARPLWQMAGAMAVLALAALVVWLALRTKEDSQVVKLQPTPTPTAALSPSPLPSPTISPSPRVAPPEGAVAPPEGAEGNAGNANRPQPEKATPPASRPPASRHGVGPTDNPSTAPLLALNDDGGEIKLDAQGNLYGLEAAPQPERRAIARALQTGRLDAPASLSDIKGKSGTLMGEADAGETFSIVGPAGTITSSDRPTFRWRALKGASGYTVKVYDAGFNLVEASPSMTGTEWTSERPLAPGAVYQWQVTAVKDGNEVIAPSPSMPEAKFKVLGRAESEALSRSLRRSPASHLARGVIYTRAGLIPEAEREFEALLRLNPQSSVARRLLEDVRAMRRAK